MKNKIEILEKKIEDLEYTDYEEISEEKDEKIKLLENKIKESETLDLGDLKSKYEELQKEIIKLKNNRNDKS